MVLSWLGAAAACGADVLAPLGVQKILVTNGAVTGVATDSGQIKAPVVVAATGAWAPELLDPLGVRLPIERRRLDMATLEQEPGAQGLHTCITDGNSNLVIRPDMGRRIVAVAYPPEMPEVDDPLADAPPRAHHDHSVRLGRALAERLPALTIAGIVSNYQRRPTTSPRTITPSWDGPRRSPT